MRLLLAALSFFFGIFAFSWMFTAFLPPDAPAWLTTAGIVAAFALSLVLTNKLVNAPGTRFWSFSKAPEIAEPASEQEGLILSTPYQAVRCFQVAGAHDEGPHYFLELRDGAVLYLNGPYLTAYEPRTILGTITYPRKFPCTEFLVQRDRYEGGVSDIQCRGAVLEPEITLPPFAETELEGIMTLQDGDVVTSRTYEEMKAARSGKRS